jgi:hypothetical protein
MFWGITGDDVEEPGWGIASELVLEFAMLSRGFFRCPRRPWRRSSSYGGARELHLEYMEDNHSVVHTTRYFVLHILIMMLADHSRTLLVVTSDGPLNCINEQRFTSHEHSKTPFSTCCALRTLHQLCRQKRPFSELLPMRKHRVYVQEPVTPSANCLQLAQNPKVLAALYSQHCCAYSGVVVPQPSPRSTQSYPLLNASVNVPPTHCRCEDTQSVYASYAFRTGTAYLIRVDTSKE